MRRPERELGVELEQVREGGREVGRTQERERVRVAPFRERGQVRAKRALVLLQFFQAEDVRGIRRYAVFGVSKKPARFR